MEQFLDQAWQMFLSADAYIYAIGGLLASLLVIAKLTKNKVDDKYVQKAVDLWAKLTSLLNKKK